MRALYGALVAAMIAVPAAAVPPGQITTIPVDASAAQASADQANVTAQAAAQAASDAATAAAAAMTAANTKCSPSAMVPPAEMVGGAAGTGSGCRLANSVQPRITRVVPFTTGAGGTISVTWPTMVDASGNPTVPGVMPVAYVASAATAFPKCAPVSGTITPTGATIKCTQAVVTVGILGSTTSIVDNPTAGITGTVFAIPNS